MEEVILSVLIPTYNQEAYIEKALDSVLEQKTQYKYEVLVGEDVSTDNTRNVLKKYEKEHPGKITVFYRENNLGRAVGVLDNHMDLYNKAQGKYVIFLEGDDYWVDDNKIEEQVSFLERHADYVAVAHNCKVVDRLGHDRGISYPECKDEEYTVKHINNYLNDSEDVYIKRRNLPLSDVPYMFFGNMPIDGGNFILTPEEKDEILSKEPQAEKYIHKYIMARDFLNGGEKYCIWLDHYNPAELQKCPLILERIENVKILRSKSKRKATRELSKIPTRFGVVSQPLTDYILVPLTTSANREYIPMTIVDKDVIANNTCGVVNSDDKFILGVLTSKMHMTWVKFVAGRLKEDYRYLANVDEFLPITMAYIGKYTYEWNTHMQLVNVLRTY